MSAVRIEHKYFLSYWQYISIKKTLASIFGPQTHQHQKYPILSLYYDTPEKDYFFQKINGEHRHIKIRIRKYTQNFYDQSSLWLETKIKINDRCTKKRSQLSSLTSSLCPNNWPLDYRHDLLIERSQKKLKPSCFVYYEREALEMLYMTKKLRITFDQNISAFNYHQKLPSARQVLNKNNPQILMEIKYPHENYPEFLRNILYHFSLNRQYFSKYTEGLNLLNRLL